MAEKARSKARLTTLIVGGGGFIGSHLARLMIASGTREVIVAGRRSESRFPLTNGVSYVQVGQGTPSFLEDLLDRCDEVVDLAYATVPKTSFDDPVNDVLVNLPPSVFLLRESARRRVRRFVLVSSGGTVYGRSIYSPIDEAHPTDPISPYGITKLALEKYALMFHKLEGLPAIIVRPANAYGPNQLGNRGQGFVGAAIFATLRHQPVGVFGERGTIRDYIFVEDLAEGLLAALDHGHEGETYNLGTGTGLDNRAVLDVLDTVARPSGYTVRAETLPDRPFDVAANVLNPARLTYVSGWRPRTAFEEGIARTWSWALTVGGAK